MRMYDLILKKRAGHILEKEAIRWWVHGFAKGTIPDYQVAAMLMAIYFKGLNETETIALTQAMIDSGDTIDLSAIKGIKTDKHSTGGVGDKTTIVLAPLVAAAGVPVAKLSGRGLGHTGGTLDKFAAFEGFSTDISSEQFINNVNKIGVAIAGQTGNLVPADKKLYALRDVTATIDNMSLIAGSIMSKKLASGAEAIILDVKTGDGSFMPATEDTFRLAELMVKIGEGMGKRTVALITDMEQPLGQAVGNALEVQEAIATLQGKGPADLRELCLALGGEMVCAAGKATNLKEANILLARLLDSGEAFFKLRQLIESQGGNPEQADHPESLPQAAFSTHLLASQTAYISHLKSRIVGTSAMLLGAGRATKDSVIDLTAGIYLHHKIGAMVQKGQKLATLYANDESKLAEAKQHLATAYQFSQHQPKLRPLIFGKVTHEGSYKL